MTNGERADTLLRQATVVAPEMRNALAAEQWNLAARRAQEVIELVVKALMNQMSVEVPRLHDPAPAFVEAVRARGIGIDAAFLDWLAGLSSWLAEIRAPAFYQEMVVEEPHARQAVEGAERVLAFGRELMARLKGGPRVRGCENIPGTAEAQPKSAAKAGVRNVNSRLIHKL